MPITHRHDEMHRGLVPIAQLGTGGDGSGTHVLLDDQTWGATPGGASVPFDHGAMGATETIDLADGDWHIGTLSADCTVTVQGFTVSEGVVLLAGLTQDGTGGWGITWDADVDFGGGDDQPTQDAGVITWYLLWSDAGDGTIYGAKVGGSSLALADTVTDETTWGITPDAGVATSASRSDHTHGSPATPTGGSGAGEILISDSHSTPLVFADLLQNDAGDDLLYEDA